MDRELVPIEVWKARISGVVRPLQPVRVSLDDAWGCVLADDVKAPIDLPPFASSAMDGFAVRSSDVASPPSLLRLAGEVRMGRDATVAVESGRAVAVPTGGMIPAGADAVAPIEICELVDWPAQQDPLGGLPRRRRSRRRKGGHSEQSERRAPQYKGIRVLDAVPPGRHIRPAGEDGKAGDVLVAAGRRLLGPDLGALAAAGAEAVSVHPRVRVGVISTGDELVELGSPLAPGQIYDANSYTLAGAVRDAGGIPVTAPRVPDDPQRLVEVLDSLDCDVFVCSGGVSVGERDPVKLAFLGSGDIELAEIAMQPGKPQAFGTWRGTPFFGLPGNPVSVFVSFEVLVRPALLEMMGHTDPRLEVDAMLDGPIEGISDRVRMARVFVRHDGSRYLASPAGGHQSNLMAGFAKADGLAVVPMGALLQAGDSCRVIVFR